MSRLECSQPPNDWWNCRIHHALRRRCRCGVEQAEAAGGTVVRPVQNLFYGVPSGTIIDPFGHQWTIGSQFEELTFEQIRDRMKDMPKQEDVS